MFRRTILQGALAAGAALPIAARAQGRDLTVVSWGGAYQDAQREVFFRPFQQATRIRMLEETWDGGIGVLRSRIASGANTWDVVQVESEELLIGAEEGLFEPMDWAAIGGREAYIPQAVNEFGVGAILYSFILAFDRARMAQGPSNWAEFFDTARFPGKRGLRRGPKTTLEIALMADGVPADQVYALLGTPAGVDRAFRRLEAIKADLAWWERGAQPAQWLASGEVAMTNAYNGRIRGERDGWAQLRDRLGGQSLHTGFLGDHEGQPEPRPRAGLPALRGPARDPGRAAPAHPLWRDGARRE